MRIDGKRVSTFPNDKLYDMYAAMKSPAGDELSEAQRDEILKVIRIRNNNERK
jgi:hypothetical protein